MQPSPSIFSANDFQKSLRLKGFHHDIDPLKMAVSSQECSLQSIAKSIAGRQMNSQNILLTTGFGLPKDGVIPVRLPSLLVPGLTVMEQFRARNVETPTYLVYQATDFIAEVNGIELAEAKRISALMKQYLQRYIQVLHPHIANHVLIEFNCPYDAQVRQDIDKLSAHIRDQIFSQSQFADLHAGLTTSEARHSSNKGTALTYAAANVLYNGITAGYPLANAHPSTEVIVPIGGPAELPFFTLGNEVGKRQVDARPVIPFITRIGARPVYYSAAKHEIIHPSDYIGVASVRDGPIRKDFAALETDGATSALLASIYPS